MADAGSRREVRLRAGLFGNSFQSARADLYCTRSLCSDELLNQGFKDQIYDIYRYLPPATQVVILSATLPHDVLEMTQRFMTDPIRQVLDRFPLAQLLLPG